VLVSGVTCPARLREKKIPHMVGLVNGGADVVLATARLPLLDALVGAARRLGF
jgi:hypothetical protein